MYSRQIGCNIGKALKHQFSQKLIPKLCITSPQTRSSISISSKYCNDKGSNIEVILNRINSKKSNKKDAASIFKPLEIKIDNQDDDYDEKDDYCRKLKRDDKLKVLTQFLQNPTLKEIAEEIGLNNDLFHKTCYSFRKFCLDNEKLPLTLHLNLQDIIEAPGKNSVELLTAEYIRHAKSIFPHLECMDTLKGISDLREPSSWYPAARSIKRKIIFHAGPTNSGKTYHALKSFTNSGSGVYCGPLKLLAVEVASKTNELGTDCDLITGEEHLQVKDVPSSHKSCTIEMTSVQDFYDVAVIDEIQMIRDPGRGWAWTRALLGIAAKEVHLCGEEAALDLVKELVESIGEEVEVHRYKRLTKLTIDDQPLGNLDNIKPGDCIVCFSKQDIYNLSVELEKRGKPCAVIYGGLPPGTKINLTKRFNDPDDPLKILVTTDAIGMGLNLSIKRIIFNSLIKPTMNEDGVTDKELISTSQALQIAGRAGRYNTAFQDGHVTTFKREDLPILKEILERPVEMIKTAGLHPTADQIELFAYHLPKATLSNLTDIFISLCQLNKISFHMCNLDSFKDLADMIQTIELPLRARYVFCCAPINQKMPFVMSIFVKFAHKYSANEPIGFLWLKEHINYPFTVARKLEDLIFQENVFDVLDLYLWLSYRFPDMFPESGYVRLIQKELDLVIQESISIIPGLIVASSNDKQTQEILKKCEPEVNDKTSMSHKLLQDGHINKEDLEALKREIIADFRFQSNSFANRKPRYRKK